MPILAGAFQKKALRKEYIRRRDGISSSLAMIYGNAIRARLWNVPEFTEARTVAGYHSTGSEVYTGDILRDVLARGTRLCLPRTEQNDAINFYEISDIDSLQIGKYGILEPHDRCKQCTNQEVMLVPAVCATAKCQRIGYGKGCYDRYLDEHKAFTIGLVFESQMVKSVPFDKNDVPLDMLVSERHTYRR